jgi:hypothetical protein
VLLFLVYFSSFIKKTESLPLLDRFEEIRVTGVVFDLSERTGAIVVYTSPFLHGREITLDQGFGYNQVIAKALVTKRSVNGEEVHVAIFPCIPVGNYRVYYNSARMNDTTVFPDWVSEIDWR